MNVVTAPYTPARAARNSVTSPSVIRPCVARYAATATPATVTAPASSSRPVSTRSSRRSSLASASFPARNSPSIRPRRKSPSPNSRISLAALTSVSSIW
ncbi:hypothetical protein [Microbispora rosea]|uniref:hypothetical protein n=1 Tax=Microbispora rosea TaxID=58117 RepID=UPI003415BE5E